MTWGQAPKPPFITSSPEDSALNEEHSRGRRQQAAARRQGAGGRRRERKLREQGVYSEFLRQIWAIENTKKKVEVKIDAIGERKVN